MILVLASLGLLLMFCFSRSTRGGLSGPIGAYLGLVQLPVVAACMWLMADAIGWWCICPLLGSACVAGFSIDKRNIWRWVDLQPITGGGSLVATTLAITIRLL